MALTATEAAKTRFERAGRGYRRQDVDRMRKRIVTALLVIERNQGGSLGISADEIEGSTFPWVLGGYDHEDVDPFLARAVRIVRAYERSRPSLELIDQPAFDPVTAAEADEAVFTVVFRGYHVRSVDRFLAIVVDALQQRESGRRVDTLDAATVSRKAFEISMRGYSELEVDRFLDRVAATLRQPGSFGEAASDR